MISVKLTQLHSSLRRECLNYYTGLRLLYCRADEMVRGESGRGGRLRKGKGGKWLERERQTKYGKGKGLERGK